MLGQPMQGAEVLTVHPFPAPALWICGGEPLAAAAYAGRARAPAAAGVKPTGEHPAWTPVVGVLAPCGLWAVPQAAGVIGPAGASPGHPPRPRPAGAPPTGGGGWSAARGRRRRGPPYNGHARAMPFDEQDCRAVQDQAQAWACSNELLASEGFAGISVSMAFDEQGCWKLEAFLEDPTVPHRAKLAIALGLRGQVVRACTSKFANFVVQKLAEVLYDSDYGSEFAFVAGEINGSGSGLAVAQHQFGCRVVQRLIEHGGKTKEVAALIGAVLGSVEECCRQKYGHYVLQSIYQHGQPEQRQRVAAACLKHLFELAQDAQGGYLVAFILQSGEDQDRQSVQERLLARGPNGLVALLRKKDVQCGTLIVEELLDRARQRTEEMLRQRIQALNASKHGRRLIAKYKLEDGQVEQGS